MTAIIIPRRHLAQPQGWVAIAPEWADSIRAAYRFDGAAWVDDATMRLYAGTDTARRVTQEGVAGNFNGASSGVNLGNRSDLFAGLAFSIEMLIVADAASVGDTVRKQLFSKDSTAGREINIQVGDDATGSAVAGGLSFAFFNGGSVTLVAQTTGQGVAPGVVSHLCFVCRPALGADGVGMFLNGKQVPSSTFSGAATSIGATATDLYIGRRVYSGYEEPFSGAIHAVWCHNRALIGSEIEMRAAAPWMLYRADPIRIYSFPSGPIIPTLSGLTTSAITSSGARHSLTLTF